MNVFKKYLLISKYVLSLSIFIAIYRFHNNNTSSMLALFILMFILLVNDYIRSTKLAINSRHMCFSLLFTICGATVIKFFISGSDSGIIVYILLPLIEIYELKGMKKRFLFIVHSFSLYIVSFSEIGIPANWDKLTILCRTILFYVAVISIAHFVKKLQIEKNEVDKLNKKLQLANIKLKQYNLEVEELTTAKERARVSQELHDSLGHYLMALTMHLEFAKKICETKPAKVKEIIVKCEDIAKSSISSLREIVNLLKEEREIVDFYGSIRKLINNFHLITDININFNADKNLDNLSPIIKGSIYKTIQEAITNSIKHGKSSEINIKIFNKNENINLIIKNNGIRCDKIIKSNGLNGIDDRVRLLNGFVNYSSSNNLGFSIDICIPIPMEEL
ncbi:sensor histidine kinase [Clostridium estertheticum]|uniref:histidine kinase n=1 Tax=Clostridium estertheticum subsp. estertheticum TaxID=1552 RepID=A0A1J0GLY2_9CLOT|nr:sensor histidine kinase [Clostridium estertheticum]APC41894.1 histidine kinase [Clostridium estertheticum subsp. estertheticum]MBU3073253.1 sensor histidine kinase [Clostridium estertheticum]MBU3163506.1 sensor histidine kinase [Clostridium estertheticum]MBZ9616202.1 sensor histidine kinase [Clostridium estertheticum subsp. laramiense]WAG71947.1 sensor histidine kinase [Clostridium estertheticum]